VRLPPGSSGNDWSRHEHRGNSLPPLRPGFICAQLRRYDGSALRDGAALGRKANRTPPGVSALGAVNARNDGPDSIAEAAERRRDVATPGSDDARHDSWQLLSAAVCRTSLASRETWDHMSSNSDINEYYHLVVRRGAVGRKQFVWEIQDNDTARVIQSSMEPFATMEEAHRSGLSALACLTD
jgi:hypothetical protein